MDATQEHAQFARQLVVSLVVACAETGKSPQATLEFIQWMYRMPRVKARSRAGLPEAVVREARRRLLDLHETGATLQ